MVCLLATPRFPYIILPLAADRRGGGMSLRAIIVLACALAVAGGLSSTFSEPAIAATAVGKVTRVQKQAQVGPTPAAVGTPVHMTDELRTGPEARLEVTFSDGSVLTLGEHATVVVDRYVFNPEQGAGEVALTTTRAAFRFTTGKLKTLPDKSITVNTPVAALAVRGTDFWAGIVDYQYGVLLLQGKLNVSNSAGSQDITRPNYGIDFPPIIKKGPSISSPYEWPPDKIARALSQTGFAAAAPFPGILLPIIPIIPPIISPPGGGCEGQECGHP